MCIRDSRRAAAGSPFSRRLLPSQYGGSQAMGESCLALSIATAAGACFPSSSRLRARPRQAEKAAGPPLEEAPAEEGCLESSGPLADPPPPDDRSSALYLFRTVVPDGYPLAFSNPLFLDRDGDGFDAPGLGR